MQTIVKLTLAAISVIVCAAAGAIALSEEEQAKCNKAGGCVLVPMSAITEQLKTAYEAGVKKGRAKSCGLEA